MNPMLKNFLPSLGGLVCFKDMNLNSLYCNDLYADLCKIEDIAAFPELDDVEILKNIIVSDKFSINDYQQIFTNEILLAIEKQKVTILDLHYYSDIGVRAFYTMRSLIMDDNQPSLTAMEARDERGG